MGLETQAMTAHPQAGNAFVQQAVTRHRAASARGILERLFARLFDGLVYTQIWEDPRVDREALALNGQSRIMTISSGGCIYIVDFWDQAGLPGWFSRLFTAWLAFFHVRYDPRILPFLQQKRNSGTVRRLDVHSVWGRYALQCRVQRA